MNKVAVHLHGSLGESFGSRFDFVARDPRDVVRALSSQLEGFAEALHAGRFQIVAGGTEIDDSEITMAFGKRREMHIIPVADGAKSGAGKVVVGAALIAGSIFLPPLAGGAAWAVTAGHVAMAMGASMALTGVSSMLMKPQTASYENNSSDTKTSSLFDGPVNNSGQGLPIPLVYGRVLAGSTVVSAGMVAEQL